MRPCVPLGWCPAAVRHALPMRFLFRLVVLAAIVLVAIQVIPYGRDHANPKTVQEIKWNTPETRALAQDAASPATRT